MSFMYLAPDSIVENRYLVVRLLAKGGMGMVYEAIDQRLGGTVALKMTLFTDSYHRMHFEREAQLLANLRHGGLPRVIDHFTDKNGQFLVMDFIAGQDMESLLNERKRPFPHQEVLGWGEQLLNILHYLHSRPTPVFHRDIKPQNLKLNDEGAVILLDFGLAKGAARDMTRLAEGNTLLGCTLSYAPLEQIIRIDHFMRLAKSILSPAQFKDVMSEYTDARADLYSLAATMYHLMTGVAPVDAIARFLATVQGSPDPLEPANDVCPDVPLDVSTFLKQAMAIKREKRFSSTVAMRNAVKQIKSYCDKQGGGQSDDLKPRIDFKGERRAQRRKPYSQPLAGSLKPKPIDPFKKGAVRVTETIEPEDEKGSRSPSANKNKRMDTGPRVDFKGAKPAKKLKQYPPSSPKALKLNVASPKKEETRTATGGKTKAPKADRAAFPNKNKVR